MKKIILMLASLAVISFSSCYVEVRGEQRYHHPFWHHRERVEIRGENTKPKEQNSAPSTADALQQCN